MRKKSTIAAVVALGVLAVTVLCLVLFAGPRVRILNPRFQVLDVRASRGTNYWIYDGNQLVGRTRYFLHGIGIPVGVPARDGGHTQKDTYTFIVRYSGGFEGEQLLHLRADLIDDHGLVTPLRWTSGRHKRGRQDYLDFWILDSPPTKATHYRLRLKSPTEDTDLADIDFGKL